MTHLHVSAIAALAILAAALAPGCSSAAAQTRTRAARLDNLRSWGYQLQGQGDKPINLAKLGRSRADLLVIDYANHGRELSSQQVAALKRKPDGTGRLVIAYLSIAADDAKAVIDDERPEFVDWIDE